nr:unnamed protein product [Meloidogyne enterolobii]
MQRNLVKKCKVCESKINVCFHYGVCTCRACGAFFRRYLENEKKSKYSRCICLQKQLWVLYGYVTPHPILSLRVFLKRRKLSEIIFFSMSIIFLSSSKISECGNEMSET